MTKKEIVIIADYSQQQPLTLTDLCLTCHVTTDFIYDLIEYEIIYPQAREEEDWLFDLSQLQRLKTVLRLQNDLELNLAGAALVLELLDRINDLESKVELLERIVR